jgi:hypothetical protein
MKKQYILIRSNKVTKTEYFYGPFPSIKRAWDWAEEELSYAHSNGNTDLSVKEIYKPSNQ